MAIREEDDFLRGMVGDGLGSLGESELRGIVVERCAGRVKGGEKQLKGDVKRWLEGTKTFKSVVDAGGECKELQEVRKPGKKIVTLANVPTTGSPP